MLCRNFLTSWTLTSDSSKAAHISFNIALRTSSLMTVALLKDFNAVVIFLPRSAKTILFFVLFLFQKIIVQLVIFSLKEIIYIYNYIIIMHIKLNKNYVYLGSGFCRIMQLYIIFRPFQKDT